MTDRLAIQISNSWAIHYDHNQWIISTIRKRRDRHYWQPLKYIGSTKTNLLRVLQKIGVIIDPRARAIIDTWPEQFLDWYQGTFEAKRAA